MSESELEELPSWAGRSTEDVGLTEESAADPAEVAADGPATDAGAAAGAAPASATVDPTDATTTAGDDAARTTVAAAVPAAAPEQPIVVGAEPPRRGMSRPLKVLLVLFGIAALLGVGAVGYLLADAQDSTETETGGETTDDGSLASEELDGATDEAEPAASGGDGEAATDEADTTDETDEGAIDKATDGDTVTVEVDPQGEGTGDDAAGGSVTDMNDGNRQAFFKGGKVYLTGAVPSEEIGQLIVDRAAAVVGPDNVVNQYTIDPAVEIQPGESAPLYVEDVVLFEFNSIAVAEPFLPLLDLGALLLGQNPQASMTVVTRTDAVGSEAVNLEVATKRGQAVLDYWISKGVDPDQVSIDARGEEGASEDDDPETAARQRRAEFIVTGLLD